MNEHVDALIDAYLDGELTRQQERRVEEHLSACETCRSFLTVRQKLSTLVREVPGTRGLKPASVFADRVMESLEAGYVQESPWWLELRGMYTEVQTWLTDRSVLQAGWIAVPVMLLLASVFIRSVGILNTVIRLVPDSESILGQVFNFLKPAVALQVDQPWGGVLGRMVGFDVGNWTLFTSLFASFIIGLLYAAWIASWLSNGPRTISSAVEQ